MLCECCGCWLYLNLYRVHVVLRLWPAYIVFAFDMYSRTTLLCLKPKAKRGAYNKRQIPRERAENNANNVFAKKTSNKRKAKHSRPKRGEVRHDQTRVPLPNAEQAHERMENLHKVAERLKVWNIKKEKKSFETKLT